MCVCVCQCLERNLITMPMCADAMIGVNARVIEGKQEARCCALEDIRTTRPIPVPVVLMKDPFLFVGQWIHLFVKPSIVCAKQYKQNRKRNAISRGSQCSALRSTHNGSGSFSFRFFSSFLVSRCFSSRRCFSAAAPSVTRMLVM